MEPEALRLIARSATGSLRDAENILEQLTIYYGSEIGLHQVQTVLGITGDWRAKELVKHIISNDVSAGIATINSVNSDGLDLRQFNREVVEYLRGLLLIKTGSDEAVDFTPEDIVELKDLATGASMPQILRAVKLFGGVELGFDSYSTLPLELALVDCVLASEGIGSAPRQSEPEELVETATPTLTVSHPEAPPAEAEPAGMPKLEPEITTAPLSGEIEQLRLNWKRVIDNAPADVKRTNTVALLRSAGVTPVAIEDNTVVLAFKYSIHKENMEKPENQRVAERIISHFLGRSCRVRCTFEPENNHLLKAALRMGAQITHVEEK